MNIYLVLAMVVLVVGVLIAIKAKQGKPDAGLGFASRDVLFSSAERSFLGVLEQALDSRYRIFGKVRLGDIIKPAKGLTASKRTTALNKIHQKHVDFVVCTASDLAIVAVIELDDQSHEREDRAERDGFVNQALAMAQIPVVHFPAKKGYVVQEVKARLADVLPATANPATPKIQESISIPPPATTIPITENVPVQSESVEPVCPKCAAAMVKRQAAKGVHAGKWFWACSAFPKCRQVVAIEES